MNPDGGMGGSALQRIQSLFHMLGGFPILVSGFHHGRNELPPQVASSSPRWPTGFYLLGFHSNHAPPIVMVRSLQPLHQELQVSTSRYRLRAEG
jgi:hypothetical protein